ncbi:uncharacterized protein A4U43_C01F28510 [Asparagus officinalis]|uniref:Ubiquitin-like domain-containing protein n=1 Tax=Asparagus officinalis TaxID=4686 RepID=A0A5P1FSU8_ASPOF|nr:uncharacterized protein A4U43_C01F28510 [Asparagus officinalis]
MITSGFPILRVWLQSFGSYVLFRVANGICELQFNRLKKQELASLAQSAEDILRTVTASTRRDISNPEKIDLEAIKELPSKKVDRKKIVISIQDKDGQKQFRMYMDDNFSRLFKMYAEKANLKLESLVFIFDGDKVSSTATPEGLGLEDDDMLEVHIKSK